MRKLFLACLFLLALCVTTHAQIAPQIQGAGAPANPCANGGQQYVDQTNHIIYGCPNSGGNWVNLGLGSATGGVPAGTTVSGSDITFPGKVTGAVIDNGGQVFNVKAYGAKGDERFFSDAAMTAGLSTLTSATAAFTSADTGKTVTVNAGAQGLLTVSYTSGATVTGTGVQYCNVGTFNGGGSNAAGIIWLTGANTIAGGSDIMITVPGSGYTAATSAVLTDGSATCSGTIVVSTSAFYIAPITSTATFVNSTTITLGTTATTTVTNAVAAIGTNDFTTVQAAITAAYNNNNGGTVYFPPATYLILSQLVIPNNAGSARASQPPITLTGQGGSWDGGLGREGGPNPVSQASSLDLRYTGTGGKIDTTGRGTFTISHLSLTDNGFDTTPFIRTTYTTIFPKDNDFIGSGPGYMASSNDAIVLGNVVPGFGGYGTVIGPNFFSHIRRGIYGVSGNVDGVNGVIIKDNTWSADSGGDSAITIDGTTGGASYNVWYGNLIEAQSYLTGVTFINSRSNYGSINTFFDSSHSPVLTLSGTSTGNSCIQCTWLFTSIRDITGGNNVLYSDGQNFVNGNMELVGTSKLVIGTGIFNAVPLAPLEVQGNVLVRNGKYELAQSNGTLSWSFALYPTSADLDIGIPAVMDGAIDIIGSNQHVLVHSTTDNGTDMLQVTGSANISTSLTAATVKTASGAVSGNWNCVNVTPVTTTGGSTTNDQNTLACTIPAGTLNLVGKTLSIRYKGLYTTNAANLSTINLKIKICSVSGCATGNVLTLATITSAANAGGVTNFAMGYVGDATTQTAGAALAEESHGLYTLDIAATSVLPETVYSDTNTATLTGTPSSIDSTAQNFLQVSCAFSIASASNTCQGRQLVVESIQ